MKYPNSNIFAAWFLMLQTLAMGWVAAMGRVLLGLLGVATTEGDVPGRLVGALLLLLIVFLVWYFMHGLPPHGKPEGNGFKAGHRVLLIGNILAGLLFVFHFFAASIDSHSLPLVLNKFTTSFGYFSMGLFAVGFSLVYQSSLPQEKNS